MIADAELRDTFVPALDHLPRAQFECVRLGAITRTVKLHTVSQQAGVMKDNRFTLFRLTPRSLSCDQISQPGRSGSGCRRDFRSSASSSTVFGLCVDVDNEVG